MVWGSTPRLSAIFSFVEIIKKGSTFNLSNMEDNEKQERVYQLTKELEETKRRKKHVVKGWNDEIKRLQDEIKHIINPPDLEEELP